MHSASLGVLHGSDTRPVGTGVLEDLPVPPLLALGQHGLKAPPRSCACCLAQVCQFRRYLGSKVPELRMEVGQAPSGGLRGPGLRAGEGRGGKLWVVRGHLWFCMAALGSGQGCL